MARGTTDEGAVDPAQGSPRPWLQGPSILVLLILVGSAVALSLGAYGRIHQPTGQTITTLGFPTMLDMKAWLTTAAVVLAVGQLGTALRMYGRIGRGPASRAVALGHRITGVLLVLVTLPVAFQCLWGLGFGDYNTRVLVHSVAGCAFYGALVTKLLALRIPRVPPGAIPFLGATVFVVLVLVWWTSSLWYFTSGAAGY